MFKRIATVVVILLLVTLQIVLGQWFAWWTPELVLSSVLVVAILDNPLETIWWVTLGGFLLDSTIGSPAGFYLASLSLIALFIISLSRNVFQQPTPLIACLIFLLVSFGFEVVLAFITDSFSWHLLIRALSTTSLATLGYSGIYFFGGRREVIQLG